MPTFVIAGLGNPGKQYEKTRHNMGFRVIDTLADANDIKVNKLKHKALTGNGMIAGHKVLLVKPQTYMNLSGYAIGEIMDYYDVPLENLVVVYDDLDTDLGAIRIRKKGGAGTHNGMKSVIEELGAQDFPRIRVGIGGADSAKWRDFVTSAMNDDENKLASEAIREAARAIEVILQDGADMAMNRFNVRKEKPKVPDKEKGSDDEKRND